MKFNIKNLFRFTKTTSASWQSRWVAQFILLMSLVFVSAVYPQTSHAGDTALDFAQQTQLLCKYKIIYLIDPKTNAYEAHLINLAEGRVLVMEHFNDKDFMLVSYFCIQHDKSITLMYAEGDHFKLDL